MSRCRKQRVKFDKNTNSHKQTGFNKDKHVLPGVTR